jgi:hypothetical protein
VCNMSKPKKPKTTTEAVPFVKDSNELANYVPPDNLPKFVDQIGIGLDAAFSLAKEAGAIIVGKSDSLEIKPKQ